MESDKGLFHIRIHPRFKKESLIRFEYEVLEHLSKCGIIASRILTDENGVYLFEYDNYHYTIYSHVVGDVLSYNSFSKDQLRKAFSETARLHAALTTFGIAELKPGRSIWTQTLLQIDNDYITTLLRENYNQYPQEYLEFVVYYWDTFSESIISAQKEAMENKCFLIHVDL